MALPLRSRLGSLSRRRPLVLLVLLLAVLAGADHRTGSAEASLDDAPQVLDDRLQLTLFAADPDIVTPIGLAIDDQNRLYVLESHTHLPPSDYAGPDGDRIKVFTDTDGDGAPDDVRVFAEGFEDGMNLAFSPSGVLYLITSREVWALYDRDGDGTSEAREKVAGLTAPSDVYDHAGLLGITFGPDGWMYLARGNVGGKAWRLAGSDGSAVEGYGDGGNIMRARPDGSDVQEVATGFWNPFDLKVDVRGRLLAADNDPDSRGPNRLVHVIEGGDYGYKALYGGSGIHPYLAWNGELPGTLPYAAGLGEAPSGLLEANRAALPDDYAGDVLCTIWEERAIVRVHLEPDGVSLKGTVEPLIQGGPAFRPVALAADRNGTIYFTDWMMREYPNHGHGRIWRLQAKPGVETVPPRAPFADPKPDSAGAPLQAIYNASGEPDVERLRAALRSDDPFLRSAAVTVLARPAFQKPALEATRDADADVRLGALLALERAALNNAEPVARRLLADPDVRVRQAALVWIGRAHLTKLRPDLEMALTTGTPTPDLFETYLATVRHLDPQFVAAYEARAEEASKNLERSLPPGFVDGLVADAALPPDVRAMAVAYLEQPADHLGLLLDLVQKSQDLTLRLEAVRSLGGVTNPSAGAALLAVARNPDQPATLRAEALLALTNQPDVRPEAVLNLLGDEAAAVQEEAARYLRQVPLSDSTRAALAERYAALAEADNSALREQLAFLLAGAGLGVEAPSRPASPEAWQEALAQGGDPEAGRRVFFSRHATCAACHAIQKRGSDLGPDLTYVGRSKGRSQIVQSILHPSEAISPEWQGWYVKTADGQTHTGRQIDVGGGGSAELYTSGQGFVTYTDVQEYGPVATSLMPAGLEAQLTTTEFRDLVAFLAQDE